MEQVESRSNVRNGAFRGCASVFVFKNSLYFFVLLSVADYFPLCPKPPVPER